MTYDTQARDFRYEPPTVLPAALYAPWATRIDGLRRRSPPSRALPVGSRGALMLPRFRQPCTVKKRPFHRDFSQNVRFIPANVRFIPIYVAIFYGRSHL